MDSRMVQEVKVLENRLRRKASRQGLHLQKSRTRDPDALDFGGFMLVDPNPNPNTLVAGGSPREFSMTLEDVVSFLTSKRRST